MEGRHRGKQMLMEREKERPKNEGKRMSEHERKVSKKSESKTIGKKGKTQELIKQAKDR